MSSIKEYVLSAIAQQPTLSNDALATMVRKAFKGANTSPASIASIKSNARRSGELERANLVVEADILTHDDFNLPADSDEPEEVIGARLKRRFDALDRMAQSIIKGVVPSLIVSGPPGLGKSYGLRTALEAHAAENEDFQFDFIGGSISAVGLYIALYRMSGAEEEGGKPGVVILDDADDVFRDETTLNILKVALDSNERRIISWRKQAHWLEEEGIPDRFEFKGSVVFLTNVDFEAMVASGRQGAQHFKALMDRSMYLHLTLRTLKDFMVRIKQVVYGTDMLAKYGLKKKETDELVQFVDENRSRFYHLSLRLVHQIALCKIADPENWRADIEMTKMRVE